jgi:hypothetical protein
MLAATLLAFFLQKEKTLLGRCWCAKGPAFEHPSNCMPPCLDSLMCIFGYFYKCPVAFLYCKKIKYSLHVWFKIYPLVLDTSACNRVSMHYVVISFFSCFVLIIIIVISFASINSIEWSFDVQRAASILCFWLIGPEGMAYYRTIAFLWKREGEIRGKTY